MSSASHRHILHVIFESVVSNSERGAHPTFYTHVLSHPSKQGKKGPRRLKSGPNKKCTFPHLIPLSPTRARRPRRRALPSSAPSPQQKKRPLGLLPSALVRLCVKVSTDRGRPCLASLRSLSPRPASPTVRPPRALPSCLPRFPTRHIDNAGPNVSRHPSQPRPASPTAQ